ncbi:MAG: hypothetical protein EHM20_03825, partial [Alphaproteobacteria bacterium]
MDKKIIDALDQLETVRGDLSESFNQSLVSLKQYLERDNPVICVLSTNNKTLKDFNDSYATASYGWKKYEFNTEEISLESAEPFATEISSQAIFSDY